MWDLIYTFDPDDTFMDIPNCDLDPMEVFDSVKTVKKVLEDKHWLLEELRMHSSHGYQKTNGTTSAHNKHTKDQKGIIIKHNSSLYGSMWARKCCIWLDSVASILQVILMQMNERKQPHHKSVIHLKKGKFYLHKIF